MLFSDLLQNYLYIKLSFAILDVFILIWKSTVLPLNRRYIAVTHIIQLNLISYFLTQAYAFPITTNLSKIKQFWLHLPKTLNTPCNKVNFFLCLSKNYGFAFFMAKFIQQGTQSTTQIIVIKTLLTWHVLIHCLKIEKQQKTGLYFVYYYFWGSTYHILLVSVPQKSQHCYK